MSDEKRMAGDYEVFASMSVGCKEIIMGENPKAEEGARYMTTKPGEGRFALGEE